MSALGRWLALALLVVACRSPFAPQPEGRWVTVTICDWTLGSAVIDCYPARCWRDWETREMRDCARI